MLEETDDWYQVKPRKCVDVKINNNKVTEFKKDDLPTQVNQNTATETLLDETKDDSTLISEEHERHLSFARKQLLKKPMKSALKRTVLCEVRRSLN